MTDVRFPNESPEYREARNALLAAEAELRAQTERVASMRRALPLGGLVKEDYAFDELDDDGNARQVKLSELFVPGKDTLVVYGYMYGPDAAAPCPLCTSMLDSLNGGAAHITDHVGLVVSARSSIDRVAKLAAGRGWTNLRMVSSANNTYQADYFAEMEGGGQMPMANVFVRRDGQIHHTWGSELLYAGGDGDSRHIDTVWPLWNVLDWTPAGRGEGYPKLSY